MHMYNSLYDVTVWSSSMLYDDTHVYKLVLLTAQLTSTESDPGGSGATGRFRVETGEIESDDVSKLRHILMTVTPYTDKCTSANI